MHREKRLSAAHGFFCGVVFYGDDGSAGRWEHQQFGGLHVAAEDVAGHAMQDRLAHRYERVVSGARAGLCELEPERKGDLLAGLCAPPSL